MRIVTISLFAILTLALSDQTSVSAQTCDRTAPGYWERIEYVDENGVEHWLCSCGDRWVVAPVATPVSTVAATATATLEPALTPAPTAQPTTTTITDVVASPTPEPTPEWTDIVVTPTATATNTLQIITIPPPATPAPAPTVQAVSSTSGDGITQLTFHAVDLPDGGKQATVPHDSFTEVYTITAKGEVTRDVRDSAIHLAPVTGGEPSWLDRLMWLIEDYGDLGVAWVLAAALFVTFVIASIAIATTCAARRISHKR